jgi:hypothetical protein
MQRYRIHLDSRADHNALMAQLCRQAAAGLARKITHTNDPVKRDALRRRMHEHELQSEQHRRIADELASLSKLHASRLAADA